MVGVVPETLPVFVQLLGDPGDFVDRVTDLEKRGFDMCGVEYVHDLHGRGEVGTVIEGERDVAARGGTACDAPTEPVRTWRF